MNNKVKDQVWALHNPDDDVRIKAIVQLREHLSILEVQHALRMCLHDSNGHVQILSAEALSRAKLYPKESIPVLITCLDIVDEADISQVAHAKEWRRITAGALANYGYLSEPAIPALRNALLDPDANVRCYAAIALGKIGPPAVVALQDLRATRQSEPDTRLREIYEQAIKKIMQSERFIVISKNTIENDFETDRFKRS